MRLRVDIPRVEFEGAIENEAEVLDEIGAALALSQRRRLLDGKDADGRALPSPKDGGQPFNRTGAFLASIKYRKNRKGTGGTVAPAGRRSKAKRGKLPEEHSTSIGGRRKGRGKRGQLARTNRDLARLYLVRKYWHASGQSVQLIGATEEDDTRSANIARDKIKASIRVK